MEKNKKILLADDIELFLEMERNFLQRDDLDLLISKDGRRALEMIRQHAPQIAFLGLKMPGLSGDECCRSVKSDPSLSGTAVAMIVAAGNPEQVEKCRDAGCDEILFKPINHDEFLAIVRRYVDLEVRSANRLKAQVRVYYGPAPQKLLSEFSVDLSTGGLYVKTDFPLAVDESLTLRFSLPDQKGMVTCQARVAWVNPKENPRKPELPPGMGIQFVELSLEDMKSIRRFLEYNELEPSW
jgi:uncharacterized protein (TIGR02266 family)